MDHGNNQRITLQAGPLAMVFDVDTAFLRRIRVGDVEAVRGLYAAVRDHEWSTIPSDVELVEKAIGDESFHLVFDVKATAADVDFRWRGTLTGDATGTVRYTFDGRACTAFLRNRIGFCLLHPADVAGTPCTVEHDDGSAEEVRLPEEVAPYQPILDVRALTNEVNGAKIEIRFEGDVFEMEDQRNWSDASFKTYCTPLKRPMPVELREGDRVQQAVTLRLLNDAPSAAPGVYTPNEPVHLRTERDPSGTVPAVGAYFSGTREAVDLPFHHLRVDVDTTAADLEDLLEAAAAAAERLSASLFVSAMIGDAGRLARCSASLRAPVSHWLVLRRDGLATSADALKTFRESVDTEASVGGGSNAYFTQLNRTPPPRQGIEFACFSVNPQVHAFDELSMMETLPMHAVLVENSRRIAAGRPVAVSPITLRPRFKPEAGASRFDPGTGYDPRQDEPFGAAWTAGSFVYLCEAGTEVATYHDVSTLHGPLASLISRILAWQGLPTRRVASNDPERVLALAVGSAPRSLLTVNLTPYEQKAVADGRGAVLLPPYSYTILEEGL